MRIDDEGRLSVTEEADEEVAEGTTRFVVVVAVPPTLLADVGGAPPAGPEDRVATSGTVAPNKTLKEMADESAAAPKEFCRKER